MNDIGVKLGETLDRVVSFFADEDATEPLNLAGWTLEVFLESYNLGEDAPVVLTEGSGFTKPSASSIRMVWQMSPSAFTVGLGRWYAKLVNPEGKAYFRGGKLAVGRP